jgi:hypothetical protein
MKEHNVTELSAVRSIGIMSQKTPCMMDNNMTTIADLSISTPPNVTFINVVPLCHVPDNENSTHVKLYPRLS